MKTSTRDIYLKELRAYLTGYWLSDLSQFSAFFFERLSDINWIGFYLSDGKILRLGPFCGKPACTEIAFGRGVCGSAFSKNEILLVDDVDSFSDHIRCDTNSKSELVVPLVLGGKVLGVLDVDSPSLARFKPNDTKVFTEALSVLCQGITEYKGARFGELA